MSISIKCIGCYCCEVDRSWECGYCECCETGTMTVKLPHCLECKRELDNYDRDTFVKNYNENYAYRGPLTDNYCKDCAESGIGYPQDGHIYAYYYDDEKWEIQLRRYRCATCDELTNNIAEYNSQMICAKCMPSDVELLTSTFDYVGTIITFHKWSNSNILNEMRYDRKDKNFYLPCFTKGRVP